MTTGSNLFCRRNIGLHIATNGNNCWTSVRSSTTSEPSKEPRLLLGTSPTITAIPVLSAERRSIEICVSLVPFFLRFSSVTSFYRRHLCDFGIIPVTLCQIKGNEEPEENNFNSYLCVFFFTVPFFPFPLSSSLRFASFLEHSLLWSFYRSAGVDTCALATLCSYLGFEVFLSSANFSNSQSITPATNYSFPVIRNYCYKSLIETGSSSLIGK